jgi:ubiquinone/menaquinone biosynthesis C-methylase UbiE
VGFTLSGKEMDRMPNVAFRMMAAIFRVRDWFVDVGRLLDRFGIQEGQTIVDYGCGPGSYLKRASELAGPSGHVHAVDIHELAIEAVNRHIKTENLTNVTAAVAVNGTAPLPDETADLIYALDMFHMVGSPDTFLRELNRICKANGVLFIDDGHQPRKEARQKIEHCGAWEIVEDNKRYMKCRPVRTVSQQI